MQAKLVRISKELQNTNIENLNPSDIKGIRSKFNSEKLLINQIGTDVLVSNGLTAVENNRSSVLSEIEDFLKAAELFHEINELNNFEFTDRNLVSQAKIAYDTIQELHSEITRLGGKKGSLERKRMLQSKLDLLTEELGKKLTQKFEDKLTKDEITENNFAYQAQSNANLFNQFNVGDNCKPTWKEKLKKIAEDSMMVIVEAVKLEFEKSGNSKADIGKLQEHRTILNSVLTSIKALGEPISKELAEKKAEIELILNNHIFARIKEIQDEIKKQIRNLDALEKSKIEAENVLNVNKSLILSKLNDIKENPINADIKTDIENITNWLINEDAEQDDLKILVDTLETFINVQKEKSSAFEKKISRYESENPIISKINLLKDKIKDFDKSYEGINDVWQYNLITTVTSKINHIDTILESKHPPQTVQFLKDYKAELANFKDKLYTDDFQWEKALNDLTEVEKRLNNLSDLVLWNKLGMKSTLLQVINIELSNKLGFQVKLTSADSKGMAPLNKALEDQKAKAKDEIAWLELQKRIIINSRRT